MLLSCINDTCADGYSGLLVVLMFLMFMICDLKHDCIIVSF